MVVTTLLAPKKDGITAKQQKHLGCEIRQIRTNDSNHTDRVVKLRLESAAHDGMQANPNYQDWLVISLDEEGVVHLNFQPHASVVKVEVNGTELGEIASSEPVTVATAATAGGTPVKQKVSKTA